MSTETWTETRIASRTLQRILEGAILYAVTAHAGQKDLCGEPYILHPLRVMEAGANYAEKIIGVLHDVIEDCGGWALNGHVIELLGGVDSPLYNALDAITHRKGPGWKEPHGAYIRRVAANPIARAVKINDLHDNMAPWRVKGLKPKMARRLGRRYPACLKVLRAAG
jgi:hypothetical protein